MKEGCQSSESRQDGKQIYPTTSVSIFKKRKNDSEGDSEINRVVTPPQDQRA